MNKIVVAITGASGAIYAERLLNKLVLLEDQYERVDLVFSSVAQGVWRHELGSASYEKLPFKTYKHDNFYAPCASGSAGYNKMIVIPCTMGTAGRIANGVSSDLICRAADVMLKERQQLILVTREAPLNLIHIRNMETLTLAGASIIPASPSFYSKPQSIEEMVDTVVDRVLQHAGFDFDRYKWGSKVN
jgi:4-hydroxy-3-polyprenylbenzoate decarboxylase